MDVDGIAEPIPETVTSPVLVEGMPSGAFQSTGVEKQPESGGERSSDSFRPASRRTSEFSCKFADAYSRHSSVIGIPPVVSPFITGCIVVNYISFGYVLLPWAFAQGGTLLSCLVLGLTALQSDITAVFVLEACARAEALKNSELHLEFSKHSIANLSQTMKMDVVQDDGVVMETEDVPLDAPPKEATMEDSPSSPDLSVEEVEVANYQPPSHVHRRQRLPRNYSMAIRLHTYELSELCRIFLGNRARVFFTLTTALDLFGITWAIGVIFGSTLAEQVPLKDSKSDYYYYMLIFAAITIPLACVPIIDQCWIQMCFLAARTVMVSFMICTVAVAYTSTTPQFGTQVGPIQDVPLADWSNLIVLIQVCIFSTAFQFAVPGMAGASRNKKTMLEIFGFAVSYVFVSNLIVSLILSIFFGRETIAKSSNLNWIDYHGGTWDGSGDVDDGRTGWASFIAKYVVLFAAIDGIAVFPLITVSLGDILLGAFYGEMAHIHRMDWKRRTAFRLTASVPQTVLAMFARDLSVIATYAGIFTLLSYTTCPSLLAIKSHGQMIKANLPTKTYYGTILSSAYWAWGLCILSILVIVGVIINGIVS